MDNQDRKDLREALDRTRRIETRITKIGRHLNVDVGGGRPVYQPENKRVTLPSLNCSIGEVLECAGGAGAFVQVYINDEFLGTLQKA